MSHHCKYPGCTTETRKEHWACQQHWWHIPVGLRVKLNRAWRSYQHERRVADGVAALAALNEYRAAENAILVWAAAEAAETLGMTAATDHEAGCGDTSCPYCYDIPEPE